jgi:hypothetical protein
MGIVMFLLGALAVLPGQEAQETKPELLRLVHPMVRLPLEPVSSPLGRSVFVVGKRTTSGSTFVAAVDGTTGERRWKFEIEGGPVVVEQVRGVKSKRGAMIVARLPSSDWAVPQRWIVLDANDGKLLRELTLDHLESFVALELEADGAGTCTTVDLAGYFRRRDLRTGDELASGGWYSDGCFGQGVQIPDETGDGVPELASLAFHGTASTLHAFDGLSLELIRTKELLPVFGGELLNGELFGGFELSVVSTLKVVRLLVSAGGFVSDSHRHVLFTAAFSGTLLNREPVAGLPMVLADGSSALARFDQREPSGMRARFVALEAGPKPERVLSEMQLPDCEVPSNGVPWLPGTSVHHGDSTYWITLARRTEEGSEPVLAAYDVATGREVWKSENLLR